MKFGSPAVLLYHSLTDGTADRDPAGLSVTSVMFERQMQWLKQHGWQGLDLDGYLASRFGSRSGRRSVLLTFDDGFRSMAELGFPVVRRLDFSGLLFVPAGMLGKTARWWDSMPDAPLVDDDELRTFEDVGIEIGVHGMEHAAMPGLSDAELRRHTHDARDALADLLGKPPRAFAYPDGVFDARAAAAVERAGFTAAFSVIGNGGRFSLPRAEIVPADDLRRFRLKLSPGYPALRRWRQKRFPR